MMEEWKLVLLILMATLSLWVLCTLVLPCAPGLLAVVCVSILMSCWAKCKDKLGVHPGTTPSPPRAGLARDKAHPWGAGRKQ